MKRPIQLKQAGKRSETIGFRLDDAAREVLESRAALFEQSPHALARQMVLEGLMGGGEMEQMARNLSELKAEIVELRQEFAHSITVLLVSAGKIDSEVAEKWAKENLNQHPNAS